MLSIGEFSKLSKVTPNTLRYYDEIGLLKPTQVNEDNGYRFYDTSQLHIIVLINKLKLYAFSLEEIADVLKNPYDNGILLSLLRKKQWTMKENAKNLEFALHQLNNDMLNLERGMTIMSYLENIEVNLINKEPENILYFREMMSTDDYGKYIGKLYERIVADKLTVTGAPITVFHHESHNDAQFNPENYDNEIAMPIKEKVEGTRELPGGMHIKATLKGPYSGLTSVYAKLRQWVEDNGYEGASEAYEVYLTDPFKVAPEGFITEVYVPVKKK